MLTVKFGGDGFESFLSGLPLSAATYEKYVVTEIELKSLILAQIER